MKKVLGGVLAAGLLMLAAGGGAAPQEDAPRIEKLNLGTYWYGTEITKKDLLGKVVLVEIWGS